MLKDKKIIVVMPAYNAAKTLKKTYEEVMAQDIVDLVILVDDASHDDTAKIAASLPQTKVHIHDRNSGYGPIRKPVTSLPLRQTVISSSWSIPIISIRRNSFPPWLR